MVRELIAQGGTHAELIASQKKTIRLAWTIYAILLVIPFFPTLWLIWSAGKMQVVVTNPESSAWFVAAMVYIAVVVPLSFFLRERLFSAYWSGQSVVPIKYLIGMTCIWLALDTGALVCAVGSIIYRSPLPFLIPSVMLLMYYFTQWPTGNAMSPAHGDALDAEIYREPS
jgi:hypothetical protein